MYWWNYIKCDHCNSYIVSKDDMVKIGNKAYHKKCSFTKERNYDNGRRLRQKQRKDDPRIKR